MAVFNANHLFDAYLVVGCVLVKQRRVGEQGGHTVRELVTIIQLSDIPSFFSLL